MRPGMTRNNNAVSAEDDIRRATILCRISLVTSWQRLAAGRRPPPLLLPPPPGRRRRRRQIAALRKPRHYAPRHRTSRRQSRVPTERRRFSIVRLARSPKNEKKKFVPLHNAAPKKRRTLSKDCDNPYIDDDDDDSVSVSVTPIL